MKLVRKIFRTIGKAILIIIGIAVLGISLAAWKYQSIVSPVPNSSVEKAKMGEKGQFVNTFIGTGGYPYWVCGFNFPGATVPFGMVRLSPETMSIYKDTKDFSTSGYYYADNKMLGFSHTRLAGTGATDGGHFLFTPTSTEIKDIDFKKHYTHHFSHENEIAYPGYYSVLFKDENIRTELTTTERAGLHRYTFDSGSQKNILINITNTLGNYPAKDGKIKIIPQQKEIEGSVRTYGTFAGRYNGIKVFFVARFDTPFEDFGIWDSKKYNQHLEVAKSDSLKVYLNFKNDIVNVKVGLSYVSLENARLNLEKEVGSTSFDAIQHKAKVKWEEKLSLIQIDEADVEDKTIFYSALYRCFQMPTSFNDVNGDYIGFDNKIHQVEGFTYYTDLSLWDTFRTVHPLYNLIAKNEQRDMLVSLVKMAEQGGSLPRWPMGNGYSNSMLGSPADMVITESYLKGITDFNVDFIYEKMKQVALNPLPETTSASGRRGIKGYLQYGYSPTELGKEAVSQTLEYAWADHSISLLAEALNKPEDQLLFKKHADFYKNVWNPRTQYFQSKSIDGNFVTLFDPLQLTYTDWNNEYTKDYVEGSALQWRWAVPFDPDGLIGLFKDKNYFVKELNDFFEKSNPKKAAWIPGSYYWHGNQPDIHAAYLFNSADRPDLTQKWVRWILKNKYDNSYVGIDGNDDAGTLSAWYIFSSLGFYPIAGTDIYQLGAPLFKNAIVNLGTAKLHIETENYDPTHLYVKAVFLNGERLKRNWIWHHEITDGGTLKFEMSKESKQKQNL